MICHRASRGGGPVEQSAAPELVARVERLERSRRRDRAVIAAIAILALATAQTPGSAKRVASTPIVLRSATGSVATLTSGGLTLNDAAGHRRLFVGIDADGRPSVDLGDSKGVLRESMYLLNEQPVLRQFDSSGKRRAEIRLDATNDGELLLTDASERLRLALFRTKGGDPQLGLYGSDEKLRAFFSSDDQSPYLVMRDGGALVDGAHTDRISLGGYRDGSIGMSIHDAAGKTLWKAP